MKRQRCANFARVWQEWRIAKTVFTLPNRSGESACCRGRFGNETSLVEKQAFRRGAEMGSRGRVRSPEKPMVGRGKSRSEPRSFVKSYLGP
jgi:hypothetical protein